MTVTITSSPSRRKACENDAATRLRLSVVPRVKTISAVERTLRNERTRSRAASCNAVASCESVWMPRCTLALQVV